MAVWVPSFIYMLVEAKDLCWSFPQIIFCLPGPAATNSAIMSGQQASGIFLFLPPWNGNPTVEPFYVNNGDPNSSVSGCTASTLLSHSPSFIFLTHTRLSNRGNVKV